ncbi:TatD family hydrolase [Sulfuriroseicoccus oceanibius]|uniref:TatD family hydrolase n=1 Tax=Sulfuriroseicoccus oceanibius TaxID=2707525 RepID=A0A6B3LA45_9BACT|nr:TatD family hydrolase [Sulfuriroseicoccus oceanibius]QQL44211.1 TatD family hydrolase [Sulfuriroseicoccus oceanibius]
MFIIQPHYHAIARTAQDYERMAMSGVVAVAEPAFWAGFDRDYPETFLDYFKQITEFEPTRAAQYGIRHFSWVAVNPKEAENPELTDAVCAEMPKYFKNKNVLGVGEIGLHKSTPNEIAGFEQQIQLALDHDQLILIHTPHLNDKLHGTKKTLEILENFSDLDRKRVWIDHVEEHTVKMVLDAGYWAGMTLYPQTKMTGERAADILEMYGWDRMLVNSSADWGPSDPFTLQECVMECRRRGLDRQELLDIFHNNPCRFLSQCPNWDIAPIKVVDDPLTT